MVELEVIINDKSSHAPPHAPRILKKDKFCMKNNYSENVSLRQNYFVTNKEKVNVWNENYVFSGIIEKSLY